MDSEAPPLRPTTATPISVFSNQPPPSVQSPYFAKGQAMRQRPMRKSVLSRRRQRDRSPVVAEVLEDRTLLSGVSGGSIDATFGGDGTVVTDISGSSSIDDARDVVAYLSTGKVVVVGSSNDTNNMTIVRYDVDGSLDLGFGIGGVATVDFGVVSNARSVAVDESTGDIIVAGATETGSARDFAVARLDSLGALLWKTEIDFGNEDDLRSVEIAANGKIVVGGAAVVGTTFDFAAARLNSNGTPDMGFGVAGKTTLDFSGTGSASEFDVSITLDNSDNVVFAGRSNNNFAIARLLELDGTVDVAGFGAGGKVTVDVNGDDFAFTVAVDSVDRIVVGGRVTGGTSGDFAVVRLMDDGSIDSSFGINGEVLVDFNSNTDFGFGVVIDVSDNVLIAGDSDGSLAVARLLQANGDLDSTFGTGGKTEINFGGPSVTGGAIALDHLGRVLVSGTANSAAGDFAVARLGAGAEPPPVNGAEIQCDPLDPANDLLAIGGTDGNDKIRVTPSGNGSQINVKINNADVGTFSVSDITRIVIYGYEGDDDIVIASSVDIDAWIYGGAGNDKIKGGGGNDVIVGGEGDDLLKGNSGRDMLIGGAGADRIIGNSDDDIIIAGLADFENDEETLDDIMTEWTSASAVTTRVANLTPIFQDNVHDDGVEDVLTGSDGNDWFFFNDEQDRVTDLDDDAFTGDITWILLEGEV